jgi:hypothetical protein
MRNELGMEKVYDYMFQALIEYAKLQLFEPEIPKSAQLVTQDYLLCIALPIQKLLMHQVRKLMPYSKAPCKMSQPLKDFSDLGWEASKNFDKTCWA